MIAASWAPVALEPPTAYVTSTVSIADRIGPM